MIISDNPALPTVTQRRYVDYGEAHYANGLVDGAYSLRLFGEVVTELSITLDRDEGLLAAYDNVQFRQPIRCGDILEVVGTVVETGTRSRRVALTCHVVARATGGENLSRSVVQSPALLATEATATFVVPARTK